MYKPRFLDYSYGFRSGRSAHDAIKKVNDLIMFRRVNYTLDCDIKGFFDNVDHEWLMKFLEHDIADKNFLRYIVRFLKAGVMVENHYEDTSVGTPQGGLCRYPHNPPYADINVMWSQSKKSPAE